MSQDVADVMAEKLPLGKEYECRKDAMQALRLAVLESTGHAVMVDKKASGKNRVVIRCNSLFKLPAEQERGRKQCVLYQLEGFVCPQEAGETPHQHALRRLAEAEAFAKTKGFCVFKAVCLRCKAKAIMDSDDESADGGGAAIMDSDDESADGGDAEDCGGAEDATAGKDDKYVWKWKIIGDGKNYFPHDESCTSIGKATGPVLMGIMKPKICLNRHMSGKQVAAAMTGVGSRISRANLPSKSAMYRQQHKIKHEALKWYNLNWGRLETYAQQLREMNETWTVTLEKDAGNRFEHLFVWLGSNMKVLEHGLDVYAMDSCHIKHVIAKGMQLHFLVGVSGNNRTTILAFSVDTTESGGSYTFFGEQCAASGITALFATQRNFPSLPVLFSDGMKGIEQALRTWGDAVHHGLCGRHLAGSTRAMLTRKGLGTITDPQVFALCRAPTKYAYRKQLNSIAQKNKHAALILSKKYLQFSQFAMMAMKPKPVHCQGRITSGLVEGTNGVVVQMREEDPYTMVHMLITYTAGQFEKHQKESQKLKDEGKVLTPYCSKLLASQKTLATTNQAYTVQPIGSSQYKVQDSMAAARTSHRVCIDKDNPSCNPCNFFNQHRIPCCHMLLTIALHDKELLSDRKEEFFDNFFHPSFLIKNLCLGYEDGVFNIPDAPMGPPLPKIISLMDSEEREAPDEEPMMLPPVGFTPDDYQSKKTRGRPRTKRIRSSGATGDDGARMRKRSSGLRQGRANAQAGRDVLADFVF